MRDLALEKKNQEIEKILNTAISFLEKGYLSKRENYEFVALPEEVKEFSFSKGIRMIHLTRVNYEKDENMLDKLSNIFTGIYGNNSSIVVILKSNGIICDFYLGVRDSEKISLAFSTLKSSLNGNFPGIEFKDNLCTDKIEDIMGKILDDEVMEISTVTGIPSLKSEEKEKFLQGIERVIDGMEGKEFTGMFIANPIEYEAIKEIKRGYEELYNQIYPYVDMTISLNKSEALALSESVGETFAKNYSVNLGKTDSVNRSLSNGINSSTSKGYTGNLGLVGMAIGAGIGTYLGGPVGAAIGASIGSGVGSGLGSFSKTNTTGKSSTETYGTSTSETYGETYGESKGYQNTKTDTKTETLGKTIQVNQRDKTLENINKKIEEHLERIEKAEGNGLWNVGAYFISKDPHNSIVASNIYNGIIRGENSGVEKNGVYTYREHKDLEIIKDYLYNFSNPILKLNEENIYTSIGSLVTNDELALKLNFPKKSISGLTVMEMASFGRNQHMKIDNQKISIGNLYHLGKSYERKIDLDVETLSSHTFITGSTGAGKSNGVYVILEELYRKEIKFLVIEPAKGEYKNIFGGKRNVAVYGTNKNHTELLKINPFSFHEDIHILEHVDRLTEIFNACWPMYGAMSAILKDGIEKSYESCGWDLKESENLYGEKKYPTFITLQSSLENIINSSAYSQEAKGNYTGALVTRVKSLANGLVGNIFVEDEISQEKLFNENVIVDISRIPAAETKSLIMGIIFMKLHEYRLATGEEENSKLKHVTVLEEAHNLLKRTSVEQNAEGANLQGKSVEMLTNAIAEMRTYGEGFIIADQGPGLLDPAVIRNTNTKICMRLPSLEDREIVGKSMNLTEEQIDEISKLDVGVAAIIQGNWKEACLVKFNYMEDKIPYEKPRKDKYEKELKKNVIKFLLNDKLPPYEQLDEDLVEEAKIFLEKNKFDYKNKTYREIDRYIFKLLDGDKILKIVNGINYENIEEWNNRLQIILNNLLGNDLNEYYLNLEISNSLIKEKSNESKEFKDIYQEWNELLSSGKKI